MPNCMLACGSANSCNKDNETCVNVPKSIGAEILLSDLPVAPGCEKPDYRNHGRQQYIDSLDTERSYYSTRSSARCSEDREIPRRSVTTFREDRIGRSCESVGVGSSSLGQAGRDRTCTGLCGGASFDAADICLFGKKPQSICKTSAEQKAELRIMTLGSVIMQGFVTQQNISCMRLMVLYDDGVVAWYSSEEDLRNDQPPVRATPVKNINTEVLNKGKTLVVRISQGRNDNVSLTLEIGSGPDATAWQRALRDSVKQTRIFGSLGQKSSVL